MAQSTVLGELANGEATKGWTASSSRSLGSGARSTLLSSSASKRESKPRVERDYRSTSIETRPSSPKDRRPAVSSLPSSPGARSPELLDRGVADGVIKMHVWSTGQITNARTSWRPRCRQLPSRVGLITNASCLTWWALTDTSSKSSSRTCHTGFQYTSRLHRDLRDPVSLQPVAKHKQQARTVVLNSGTSEICSLSRRAPARTRSPAPYGHRVHPGTPRSHPSRPPARR